MARATVRATSDRLRRRLMPRELAIDLADTVATRAARIFTTRKVTRKRRLIAACCVGAAIATGIVLRAVQRSSPKKNDDFTAD